LAKDVLSEGRDPAAHRENDMRKTLMVLALALLAGQAMADCPINPPSCPLGGSGKPVCISGTWQCM
jgi:hypothetical protein